MKRLICILIFALAFVASSLASILPPNAALAVHRAGYLLTTYYVSNQAANGYALGNDSNNGTSPSTPFLTISAAYAASTPGTIIINPGVTYAENTGGANNGLNAAASGVLCETDPTLVGTVGKARITAVTACAQVIYLHDGSSTTYSFQDLIVDGGGVSHSNSCAILGNSNSITVTLERVDFYGLNGGYRGWQNGGLTETWNADKCTCLLANSNTATSLLAYANNSCTYNFTGCQCNGIGWWCKISASSATVTAAASSDGTRNTMTNVEIGGIESSSGSLSAVSINCAATDWIYNGQTGTSIVDIGDQLGDTASSVTCTGNTWSFGAITNNNSITGCFMAGSGPLVFTNNNYTTAFAGEFLPLNTLSTTVTPLTATGNHIILTGTVANGQLAMFYVIGGASLNVSNNVLSNDGGENCVEVGNNSCTKGPANTTATTGFQNCGDLSADTYIDQPFTMGAAGSYDNEHYLGTAMIAMKAVGTGATITYGLYADSGGVATGSPIATAIYTVSPTSTSVLNYSFDSASRYSMTNGTVYHHVFSAGAVSASNYVAIELSATGGTTLNKGALIASLSPGTGSLLFNTGLDCLECVSPVVSGNTFTVIQQSLASAPHACIIGGTDGALYTQNASFGAGIGQLFKRVDGSVHKALMGSSVVATLGANDGFSYFKGCTQCLMEQDTVVLNGPVDTGIIEDGPDREDYLALSGFSVWNGKPATSDTIGNLIVVGNVSGASLGPVVLLGSSDNGHTCVTPTLETNNYWGSGSTYFAQVNLGTSATLTNYSTLAAYKSGTSLDTGSFSGDPLLANETNPTTAAMFIPSLKSHASNIGTNLLSSISTDYLGNAFSAKPWVGAYSIENWLAQTRASTGATIYYMLRNTQNAQVWNTSTNAFEVYVTANLSKYAVYMTQQGTSGLTYAGSIPWSVPGGAITLDYRTQGGGSPAESDVAITDAFSLFLLNWGGSQTYNIYQLLKNGN